MFIRIAGVIASLDMTLNDILSHGDTDLASDKFVEFFEQVTSIYSRDLLAADAAVLVMLADSIISESSAVPIDMEGAN